MDCQNKALLTNHLWHIKTNTCCSICSIIGMFIKCLNKVFFFHFPHQYFKTKCHQSISLILVLTWIGTIREREKLIVTSISKVCALSGSMYTYNPLSCSFDAPLSLQNVCHIISFANEQKPNSYLKACSRCGSPLIVRFRLKFSVMKRYFNAFFGKVSTFIKLILFRMWWSVKKLS